MSKRAAWLASLAAALFITHEARATCSGSVNAIVDGSTLHVTATSTGSCGTSFVEVTIDDTHYVGQNNCASPSCTLTYDYPLNCFPPGSHRIKARLVCHNPTPPTGVCNEDTGEAESSFAYQTEPTLTLTPDEVTPGQFKVTWDFPYLAGNTQRIDILTTDNANLVGFKTVSTLKGTEPVAVTCPPGGEMAIYATSDAGCYKVQSPQSSIPGCEKSCALEGGSSSGGALPKCKDCIARPIHVTSGSMEYSDADPIAGNVIAPLQRTYHSGNSLAGVFGTGWTSILDARATATGGTYGLQHVYLKLENGRIAVFELITPVLYQQVFPQGDAGAGVLQWISGVGLRYRDGGSSLYRDFDPATGRLTTIGFYGGDAVTIAYNASGKPATVADTRGRWTWNLAYTSSGRIATIGVAGHPELTWTYGYSGANLISVTAPSSLPWRTYTYGVHGMETASDAAGAAIESHTYDANSRAITSSASGDEITDIEFDLAGRVTGERKMRFTTADGKTTTYYRRYIAGRMRTVEIDGSCHCGSDDSVFDHDAAGFLRREQNARGFITERTYSKGRLKSVTTLRRPESCDPETDPSFCRLTPDTLESADLVDTALSTTTTFTYGDANWPDRPTLIAVNSLRASQFRTETFVYDAATGSVTSHTVSGYDPTAQAVNELHRTTLTTLYNGSEGAAYDPCAGASPCAFNAAWLTLAQPAGVVRRLDGPRTDVDDWTTSVHYPFDSSVPVDARGRVAAVRNAAGHITRFENYDVFGNARRVVDPNGVVTETTYDVLGRLLTSTLKGISGCNTSDDPLCATDIVTRRLYAPESGPLAIEIGPRGEATTYEYDSRGRTTAIRRGEITGSIPSTAAAAIAAATWKERIQYEYSPATGHKISEKLFAFESSIWAEKKSTTFAYDLNGYLSTTTHADGNSAAYAYDRGQVSSMRDENHTAPNTLYAYDAGGRLESVTQTLAQSTIETTYSYDAHGNLESVTDPNGNVTTYAYDDFGQMVRQQSPVTGTTTYQYDAAGNLASTTDANAATTARTYDPLGRALTATSSRSGASNETVTWTYDDTTTGRFGLGRIASMTDPAGTTTYAYERRGMLRREQRTFAGTTEPYLTTFRYDASGNRTSLTYPSGLLVNSVFDFANRPYSQATSTTNLIASTAYLPFGPPKDIVFTNGTHQTMDYDARYRIVKNKLTGPAGTIAEYNYVHDAAGNITEIADAVDAGYTRNFAYDDLNRLVTANTGAALWRTGSYTYDAMGNMLSSKLGDPELSFRIDEAYFTYVDTTPRIATVRRTPLADDFTELSRPGRPSRIQRQAVGYQRLTYDAAGNELTYVATRTYSPRNLLASVTDASELPTDNHRLEYAYDGRGIRVIRSETQSDGTKPTRYFFYSPELQLLSTTADSAPNVYNLRLRTNAVPAVKHDYVWQASRPVAQLSSTFPTGTHWTFTDHLGTPLLQTDANAQVVWRAEYEPYGDIWTMRVPSPDDEAPATYEQPLRFPGQESAMRWEGTEERYNIFRWYRAGWGRYTQSDPIGLGAGMNLFAYGAQNPLGNIDSRGLKCCAKTMTAVLAPVVTKTKVAIKSMICAEICGDSNDCTFEQSIKYSFFSAQDGDWTSSSMLENETITPGAFEIRKPSKNKVCLVDSGIGLGMLPPSAFPVADIFTATVTIRDKTGSCGPVSGQWSGVLNCTEPSKCNVNGKIK